MKRLLLIGWCLFMLCKLNCQVVLVNDNLADRSKLIDNTLLTLWGSNGSPTTGFSIANRTDNNSITYSAITLTPSAISNSGYTASNSLKTLTSIDYRFPVTTDRNSDTITVEFDAIWDATSTGGENGRLVVTLVGELPAGGAQFGEVNDTSLHNPFGKPLYNIRIRNNPSSGNGPLMLYGAGVIPDPEWEIYGTGPWWLPGFSVQAGGGSPGSGPDYPLSGTKKTSISIVSTTIWKHYTWKIMPERMELYHRNSNQSASANSLVFFMQIPKYVDSNYVINQINAAHGTSITTVPPNYNWFRYANAIRIYWRGVQNFALSNVFVTRSSSILPAEKISGLSARPDSEENIWIAANIDEPSFNSKLFLEHANAGGKYKTIAQITDEHISENKLIYKHIKPGTGIHYYRIRIEKQSGEIIYTKIVQAKIDYSSELIFVYPNPAKGKIIIRGSSFNKGVLRVYSASGKMVLKEPITENKPIAVSFNKGIYFYEIINESVVVKKGKLIID